MLCISGVSIDDCVSARFCRVTAESILETRLFINRRAVEFAIFCVQNYVRKFLFTRRDFFTDSGISMPLASMNVASTVCENALNDPWNSLLPSGHEVDVRDLKKAYDVVVVRREHARDTSEGGFRLSTVGSSVVGEPLSHGVRIFDVVEVGQAQYLPELVPAPHRPCSSATVPLRITPGKGKRKRRATPAPVAAPRLFFGFDDSIVLPKGTGVFFKDPIFEAALKKQENFEISRKSGRISCAATVLQASLYSLR